MNNAKDSRFTRLIEGFMGAGGTAAVIGLIATSEEFVTNSIAQDIGVYSAIVAAIGFVGAAYTWATKEDLKHGRTFASEFNNIKNDVTNVFAKVKGVTAHVRQEFADEYPSVPKEATSNVNVSSPRKLGR